MDSNKNSNVGYPYHGDGSAVVTLLLLDNLSKGGRLHQPQSTIQIFQRRLIFNFLHLSLSDQTTTQTIVDIQKSFSKQAISGWMFNVGSTVHGPPITD